MTENVMGFGTGSLYKHIEPASKEAIDKIKHSGCNAIELCGTLKKRFDKSAENSFLNIFPRDLEGFSYVSIHAPDDLVYNKDKETIELLDRIKELYDRLNVKLVVFHPNVINDFSIFDKYEFNIGFENMDSFKIDKRFPEEFIEILKNPKFYLVLDLTHAFTNDNSGELACKYIKLFGDKIKQIHCSGNYTHGSDNQQHFPAYLEKEYWKKENTPSKIILKNINFGVPIIIESVFPDETVNLDEGLKKELEFFNKVIKGEI